MAVAHSAKAKWADVATVTLLVGETKTAFHVHEAILFEASPFFEAAFNSEFRESSDRTMTLPEDDESIFELFVDWLYHQHYNISPPPEEPSSGHDTSEKSVHLFVLADKYRVRNLKNQILSAIFILLKQRSFLLHLGTVAYAYEHTPHGSTIRILFADYLSYATPLVWYEDARFQEWLRDHPEICTDAIVSLAKYQKRGKINLDGKMPEEYIEK